MRALKKLLRSSTILWAMIIVYAVYFSYYTILRYQTLYASYFDLGIMHQTVYNTFAALRDGTYSRLLQLTDPMGVEQIKRMAVHNDVTLALLAPFYFINSTPSMLLVIQSVVVALGALAIYLITRYVFEKNSYKNILALTFSFAYLMNPILQRANIYDFHAVVLATTTLLFMFYFYKKKRYVTSFFFLILSLTTKEQVSLTAFFFGAYALWESHKDKKSYVFPILTILTSLIWFVGSIFYLIPFFRGRNHFAVSRYSDFGDSEANILIGLVKNPLIVLQRVFHIDTLKYFLYLLGPVGFLSALAPILLFIAAPEFGINLLSGNWNMRNIIYQYTAVIQPFVFISAIYGAAALIAFLKKRYKRLQAERVIVMYVLAATVLFAWWKGPLPFSLEKEVHPFEYAQKEAGDTRFWAGILKDEDLKIMTTGQLAPFFTSREYYYTFSDAYPRTDYVVLRLNEIYNYSERAALIPVYEKLKKDPRYKLIFYKDNFEVYKKIINSQ